MLRFRLEHLLLIGLLIGGFVLRANQSWRMSIEHFDEGVYASNLFSDHLDFRYPNRELYAPPLFPAILEWTLILSHATPHAVMWVNVTFGTALIAAVWWTTLQLSAAESLEGERKRFPPVAALAAATLVMFSDYFEKYSRAALTDIPVCLWITLAVGMGARALRTGNWIWAIAASVCTALAWWTKYNGWLPIAILGAGLAGWLLFNPDGRASLRAPERPVSRSKKMNSATARVGVQRVLSWAVIAVVSFLLWSPVLEMLQAHGGYAAVAANHRGYLVGWSGWFDSLLKHAAVDRYYAGPGTAAGFGAACLFAWTPFAWDWRRSFRSRFTAIRDVLLISALCVLPVLIPFVGVVPALIFAALLGPVSRKWIRPVDCTATRDSIGSWILLAWILGLALTTPLYRPYPRLILPWLVSLNIAAGIGFAEFAAALALPWPSTRTWPRLKELPEQSRRELFWIQGGQALLFVGLIAASLIVAYSTHSAQVEDRREFQSAATNVLYQIEKDLKEHRDQRLPHLDCVIYILAEPGLYYHLAAQEDEQLKYITQPASNIGMLELRQKDASVPNYVITGPHSREEAQRLAELPGEVERIANIRIHPSSLVLLDDMWPSEMNNHRVEELQLWRVLP